MDAERLTALSWDDAAPCAHCEQRRADHPEGKCLFEATEYKSIPFPLGTLSMFEWIHSRESADRHHHRPHPKTAKVNPRNEKIFRSKAPRGRR